MAKEIIFNLKLNDNLDTVDKRIDEVVNSTDTLKQKFKELRTAAQEASDPVIAERFARAAGEIKDQIGDINSAINNFASDTKKLDVVIGTAQGIAGAFSVVQGTMALFGEENKDLEKTLLKVQGTLAVLNGLQSVANVLNKESAVGAQLYAAANAILNSSILVVNGSLNAFRVALVSTGVGAFIVGIGLLIAYWDDLAAAIGFSTEAQKEYNEQVKKLAGETQDLNIRALKEGKDKEFAELKNAQTKELLALQKRFDDEEITREQYNQLKDATIKAQATETQALIDKFADEEKQKKKKANDEKLREEKRRKDEALKIKKEEEQAEELRIQKLKELAAIESQIEQQKLEDKRKVWAEQDARYQKEISDIERLRGLLDTDLKNERLSYQVRLDALKQFREQGLITDTEYNQKKVNLDIQVNQQRAQVADQGFQLLTDINDIFYTGSEKDAKKRFENSKKIQIAQALISTYFAANQAYLSQFLPVPDPSSPVRGAVAAGLAVVSGLANVQKIRAQQFNGGGGGSDKPTPPPSGGVSAPSNPFATADQPSQVINITSRPTDSGAQRVYVLESDITNVQNKVSVIENNAKIV